MNTLALLLLLFAFIWAVSSVYYQAVIRPHVHDQTRFAIFRIRDELRAKAISHDVDAESFSFRHLESMLNRMIRICDWYSFACLIEFHVIHRERPTNQDIERFDREASPALKLLESDALHKMLSVMVVNSPGWLAVAGVVLVIDALRHKAVRTWIEVRNRALWYDDPSSVLTAY